MSKNHILVTGGAGYIGSHTCKILAKNGYIPVAYDNLSTGEAGAVRWGPLIKGDIGDPVTVAHALHEYDISMVMHFAASANVRESVQDPLKYFRNNLSNTIALVETLLANNIDRFIFSSTCATYGLPEKLPITEDHPQKPISPYGESKLAVERLLPWYASSRGLKWVTLRYFNAAGADPEGDLGENPSAEGIRLIPLAIQATFDSGEPLTIFGNDHPTRDGTAIRDFIHVSDLAGAHVSAMEYLRQGGESRSFNLGTGTGYSVSEVIAMVETVTGRQVRRSFAPKRSEDPPILTADPQLAMTNLGWRVEHSDLREIIATAWAWMSRRAHVLRSNKEETVRQYSTHAGA